jgi:hypothetical protein
VNICGHLFQSMLPYEEDLPQQFVDETERLQTELGYHWCNSLLNFLVSLSSSVLELVFMDVSELHRLV